MLSSRTKGLTPELRELEKVARKLKRLTTRKIFRKPDEKDRPYIVPKKCLGGQCKFCGRPCSFYGSRCRECFQKQVRQKYEAKVRAEEERVSIVKAIFSTLEKEAT
jgi:hypothetical protein